MRFVLIILLLLSGCQTIKKFNRTVSDLDSSVNKLSYVRSEITEQKEQVKGWQEFRITGLDSLYRLPDLSFQGSNVPLVPQFIQGKDRIIYLPSERIVETSTRVLDSLISESARMISEIRSADRSTERRPDSLVFYSILALIFLSIAAMMYQLLRKKQSNDSLR